MATGGLWFESLRCEDSDFFSNTTKFFLTKFASTREQSRVRACFPEKTARPRPPLPPLPPWPELGVLGHWRFDATNWAALPPGALDVVHVARLESWSGFAVRVPAEPLTPAVLRLPVFGDEGRTWFRWEEGTVRFWISPEWDSASLPGGPARLIDLGAWSEDASLGW